MLISRQHSYWKPTSLLLFLELQSALPLKPQNMTGSSLMWPWPVRMMSWKRLIRWCRLWLIPLPNQIIFQICLFVGKLFTNWIAPATCSFILAKTTRSAQWAVHISDYCILYKADCGKCQNFHFLSKMKPGWLIAKGITFLPLSPHRRNHPSFHGQI